MLIIIHTFAFPRENYLDLLTFYELSRCSKLHYVQPLDAHYDLKSILRIQIEEIL